MESTPTVAADDMAAPTTQLKLYGAWACSFTHRIQLALRLKGLEFEYTEENLADKSPSLLLYNPVYKKVPVLVHDGRVIAESVVILQYIDEMWPEKPLVPVDPFDRAVVRFWCNFSDEMLGPSVSVVFRTAGEEQMAAVEQVHHNLKVIETELSDGFFKGRRFFGGESVGLLDIVIACGSYWMSVFEKVAEVTLIDEKTLPRFSALLREFEELEEVKKINPDFDAVLEYARGLRQMLLRLQTDSSEDTLATATIPNKN